MINTKNVKIKIMKGFIYRNVYCEQVDVRSRNREQVTQLQVPKYYNIYYHESFIPLKRVKSDNKLNSTTIKDNLSPLLKSRHQKERNYVYKDTAFTLRN